jgi:soluble lytic murein transglycosylase-like protein
MAVRAVSSSGAAAAATVQGTQSNGEQFAGLLAGKTAAGNRYDQYFLAAGQQYGVSPALLKAVAKAESGFNPQARSSAGAEGLMQFMPGTAKSLGINPWDPQQSIMGAAKYLRSLLNQFDGNVSLALAGYNAGGGAVKKYGGIPPYKETVAYVKRVTSLMEQYGGNQVPDTTQSSVSQGATAVSAAPDATETVTDSQETAQLAAIWAEMVLLQSIASLTTVESE